MTCWLVLSRRPRARCGSSSGNRSRRKRLPVGEDQGLAVRAVVGRQGSGCRRGRRCPFVFCIETKGHLPGSIPGGARMAASTSRTRLTRPSRTGRTRHAFRTRGRGLCLYPEVDAEAWQRIDVSSWPLYVVEQAGSTLTRWVEEPSTSRRWLHKDTLIPGRGVEQGEDWAEVIATRVAQLLGAPCAATRLCAREGRRGSLSLDIVPAGYALNEGGVLLEDARVPGYFPHRDQVPGIDPARPHVRRPGHNLPNIRLALSDVIPPHDFDGPPRRQPRVQPRRRQACSHARGRAPPLAMGRAGPGAALRAHQAAAVAGRPRGTGGRHVQRCWRRVVAIPARIAPSGAAVRRAPRERDPRNVRRRRHGCVYVARSQPQEAPSCTR